MLRVGLAGLGLRGRDLWGGFCAAPFMCWVTYAERYAFSQA